MEGSKVAEDANLPVGVIPVCEKWLFENASALGAVETGLAQAAAGKTRTLGGFARYVDEDAE